MGMMVGASDAGWLCPQLAGADVSPLDGNSGYDRNQTLRAHSGLIPSSLMIGHHLSASAFRRAPNTSGV